MIRSKLHNIAILLIMAIMLTCSYKAKGQSCNHDLIDIAKEQCGKDALITNEFFIRYKKVRRTPVFVKKYSVQLYKNKAYRFSTANSKNYEGRVILQLYKNGQLVESTYDIENQAWFNGFDFLCDETGDYKVLMSFNDGRPGCAAGVMAVVQTDSTELISREEFVDTTHLEYMYLGIDNEINISVKVGAADSIQILLDRGKLFQRENKFYARFEKPGSAKITVVARDSTGQIIAAAADMFMVNEIPPPYAVFLNKRGGIINRKELDQPPALKLEELVFSGKNHKILSFMVGKNPSPSIGLESLNEKFSPQQLNFIRELKSGDEFFIYDIKAAEEAGKIIEIESLRFQVE